MSGSDLPRRFQSSGEGVEVEGNQSHRKSPGTQ